MLFARGFQLVSRPCIFTKLDLSEVYFPLANIELVSAMHISISATPGANEER